jgi:hypothetical protein
VHIVIRSFFEIIFVDDERLWFDTGQSIGFAQYEIIIIIKIQEIIPPLYNIFIHYWIYFLFAFT